jgi:hypothetical protein
MCILTQAAIADAVIIFFSTLGSLKVIGPFAKVTRGADPFLPGPSDNNGTAHCACRPAAHGRPALNALSGPGPLPPGHPLPGDGSRYHRHCRFIAVAGGDWAPKDIVIALLLHIMALTGVYDFSGSKEHLV